MTSSRFAVSEDRHAMWLAALMRCPYCGALVLPDDITAHGDAHRTHDKEHDDGE